MHCRYAVLGVQLFTYVIRGDMLTEDRNFESFGNALLLLFQALTGDDPAPMARGLQPRVLEAAPLLCARGCNLVCHGAATLRAGGCNPM